METPSSIGTQENTCGCQGRWKSLFFFIVPGSHSWPHRTDSQLIAIVIRYTATLLTHEINKYFAEIQNLNNIPKGLLLGNMKMLLMKHYWLSIID